MASLKVEGCFSPVEKCPLNSISWWLVTDGPVVNPGFDPGTSGKPNKFLAKIQGKTLIKFYFIYNAVVLHTRIKLYGARDYDYRHTFNVLYRWW